MKLVQNAATIGALVAGLILTQTACTNRTLPNSNYQPPANTQSNRAAVASHSNSRDCYERVWRGPYFSPKSTTLYVTFEAIGCK